MLESMLSARCIVLGWFRCMKKLDCTQRTYRVLAEREDVVHISLPSSGCFVTRIPFILTQLQDEICVVIIFLCTLVSFQRQPGNVDREESVVCSGIFPARVFKAPGMWGAPILDHGHSQGLWMENSTDITRKNRSWQCPQGYQLPVEGKKRQSKTLHFLTAGEERCVASEYASLITATTVNTVSFLDTFLLLIKQNSS